MNDEMLGRIDSYIEGLFVGEDAALSAALDDAKNAGLPEIQISPNQGKFLRLLAEISGARRILEIGTLGGYSGIHFARALPDDGVLISLELDEKHAEIARKNFERAGLSEKVEVRVGDAKETLRSMAENGGEEPFDLVFIDAEKEGYPMYLDLSLELSRPGTLVIADNVVRGGSVLEEGDNMGAFNEKFASDGRLDGIIIPLIREYVDGVAIARVK
ncbi:MAG: O-methyltransferase [Rubrobacteraceae bacterium]|jgi:predicted O-methyltransferase YrrM